MNPTRSFVRLRWRRVLIFTVFLLPFCAGIYRNAVATGDDRTLWAINWFVLVLPLGWGWMLSSMIHESLHRPSTLLLPGAARRYTTGHAIVVTLIAVGCGLFAHWRDPALPALPATALAAAMLTLTLPLEPGWRWAGSATAASVVATAVLVASAWLGDLRRLVIDHPLATMLGGIAWAALNLAVAFSRDRLRARALVSYTSYFSAMFVTAAEKRREQQRTARRNFRHLRWSSEGATHSARWWWHAWRYERSHERSGWNHPLVYIAAVLLFAASSGPWSQPIENILSFATATEGRPTGDLHVVLLLGMMLTPLPRFHHAYPLARRARTVIVFTSALAQLASIYLLMVGGLLLAGIAAAHALGHEIAWLGVARTAATASWFVPFAPLIVWGRLHREVTESALPVILLVCLAVFAVTLFGRYYHDSVRFTPGGDLFGRAVVGWLLATAASQALFWMALHRFHRHGDFVQRGAASHSRLGLV